VGRVLAPVILLLALTAPLARAEIRQVVTIPADKAHLRLVDYINRRRHDITLAPGEAARFRYLDIRFGECRVPRDDPARDAYAWLDITDSRTGRTIFSGWMIASSPALSAMDHLRFDLWVVGCTVPGLAAAEGEGSAQAEETPPPGAPAEGAALRPPPRPFLIPAEEPPDG